MKNISLNIVQEAAKKAYKKGNRTSSEPCPQTLIKLSNHFIKYILEENDFLGKSPTYEALKETLYVQKRTNCFE